jgi:cyclase
VSIPFTFGGGIRSIEDAAAVLEAGADKVSVNSAALARPQLIEELAAALGSQAVVVAIDTSGDRVRSHAATRDAERDTVTWARRAVPGSCSSRRSIATARATATTSSSSADCATLSRCP